MKSRCIAALALLMAIGCAVKQKAQTPPQQGQQQRRLDEQKRKQQRQEEERKREQERQQVEDQLREMYHEWGVLYPH